MTVQSQCRPPACMSVRLSWFLMQAYRELLVTTPGLGQYISGAIMFEETLYQNTSTGSTMVDELNKQNIVPGALLTLCVGVGPQVFTIRISCYATCAELAMLPRRLQANTNVRHPCRGITFHAAMHPFGFLVQNLALGQDLCPKMCRKAGA